MPTITPPGPTERMLRATAYFCIFLAGAWILAFPPETIGSVLGRTLALIWAGFLLAGLPASVAAALGRYRVEYVALAFFTSAIMVAAATTWLYAAHHFEVVPRAAFLTALAIGYAARFAALHKIVRVKRPPRMGGGPWTLS